MHTQAWKYFSARPLTNAADQTATEPQFCCYNPTFEQYTYTSAWVEYLIRHLSDSSIYVAVRAWPAEPPTQLDDLVIPINLNGLDHRLISHNLDLGAGNQLVVRRGVWGWAAGTPARPGRY